MIYCIIPRDLAAKLESPLSRFLSDSDDPAVKVLVECRIGERRGVADRRRGDGGHPPGPDRRRIRNPQGRRVADRRAPLAAVDSPTLSLPRKVQPHDERLSFVERVVPTDRHLEDIEVARLVTRLQAGERQLFADLYSLYLDRVLGYLTVALDDPHEAEDATQEVFLSVLESLPCYERRSQPFRAWLFRIARNQALDCQRARQMVECVDPVDLERRGERAIGQADLSALGWMPDSDLMQLIECLPIPQRQVVFLRHIMGFGNTEIAKILNRTPDSVHQLHHRALERLEEHLTRLGREPMVMRRRPSSVTRVLRQAPVIRKRRWALRRR